MNNAGEIVSSRIGIYVRESRDDNEENLETIETQRGLLLDFASKIPSSSICGIYEDDNISGSAFDRPGLDRLKSDVTAGRLDLLLLKDLSRLGRNNARTLLFIDFLEERGVRLITSDGRYDSLRDNETAGLETWINERYVRDISRKIKASLRFKIERGEYLGRAPFGYVKQVPGMNRLYIDEGTAPTVRLIFRLYRSGLGYSSIAGILNSERLAAPGGNSWNRIAVRRILCGRVYTGDTVQGVSERISFKSRKTRRIPENRWVVTENTHEAIISRDEYREVQDIRLGKVGVNTPHKRAIYPLHGLVHCGRCGSVMYARKKNSGDIVYICGNYHRNGRKACSSHFVMESEILRPVLKILADAFRSPGPAAGLKELYEAKGMHEGKTDGRAARIARQLAQKLRQQELLYGDRLEDRITEQLFVRMNSQLEAKIAGLRQEGRSITIERERSGSFEEQIVNISNEFEKGIVESGIIRCAIDMITVYDSNDTQQCLQTDAFTVLKGPEGEGVVVVDFIMKKV